MTLPAQNLLTVDCGNSTIDCLRHADGVRCRFDAAQADVAAIAAFLQSGSPVRVIVVSVSDTALSRLEAAVGCGGGRLELAGRDLPCPLQLDYETPNTLGADRWVGALAAYRRHGASIVVDCGSATTVNWIDAAGVFRGGAIAPGLRAMVAGMAVVTPNLPPPRLDGPASVPARSSQAAVDAGVLLGYCGMVERLVDEVVRWSDRCPHLVVTGGNGQRLLPLLRHQVSFEPDLVHRGLAWLAQGPSCAP